AEIAPQPVGRRIAPVDVRQFGFREELRRSRPLTLLHSLSFGLSETLSRSIAQPSATDCVAASAAHASRAAPLGGFCRFPKNASRSLRAAFTRLRTLISRLL